MDDLRHGIVAAVPALQADLHIHRSGNGDFFARSVNDSDIEQPEAGGILLRAA